MHYPQHTHAQSTTQAAAEAGAITLMSRTCWCRYAELLADNRTFTEEEDSYFSDQAQYAYESFRNKAALSRGMQNEQMQEFAQVSLQPDPHP